MEPSSEHFEYEVAGLRTALGLIHSITLKPTVSGLLIASALAVVPHAQAQILPDAGSVLRESQQQRLRIPPSLVPRAASEAPGTRPANEVRFRVERFRLEGITLVTEDQVQQALAAYRNRDVGFSDLERAMADVAAVYEQEGWLARVQVPEQDVVDGLVTLQVIEARMGRVVIDAGATTRLDTQRIRRTVTVRLQRGQPLNLRALERAVSVLADTPGVAVKSALTSGEREGETDVAITVNDRAVWSGSLAVDNGGSRSTGAARAVSSLSLDNPTGRGEQVGLTVLGSQGTRYAMASASAPWGYEGWRVGVSGSVLTYNLVGTLASSGAQGSAATMTMRAQYPVWRSGRTNVNAALSADGKWFENEANGANISSKTTQVVTASLSGDRTDTAWGGGYLLWSAAVAAGRLDLSGNPANQAADGDGPRSEGRYAKMTATAARLQQLTRTTTLWLSWNAQASSRNLDSSEKFALGGSNLLRGYPSGEGVGDRGWLTTVELRQSVAGVWQLAAFVDHGQIWTHHDPRHVATGSGIPNRYALTAGGLGIGFSPSPTFTLRMTAAQRMGRNAAANPLTGADADGMRPRARVWLAANWFF